MPEFNLFGVPVRVDPTFLFIVVLFGFMGGGGVVSIVSLGLAFFLSILVHEGGHAVCARMQGRTGIYVVIHGFGGVTGSRVGSYTDRQEILLSLAGPAASIAFGAASLAASIAAPDLPGSVPVLLGYLVFLNFFWGLFNLLPVFPMDGGKALGHMLHLRWPNKAWTWTHWIGVVGGVLIMVWGFAAGFMLLPFFGVMFAWQNWTQLQGPGW